MVASKAEKPAPDQQQQAKKPGNEKTAAEKQGKKMEVDEGPASAADLSEEDKKLQDDLNLCMERLRESDASLYLPSLETMRSLIRASTTSMTSVPKPLKFMRPHYASMKEIYERMPAGQAKVGPGSILREPNWTAQKEMLRVCGRRACRIGKMKQK